MASADISQIKAQVEQIFDEVNTRLDGLIVKDTELMMANDGDIMHERLFAFCDEMEALKRKIGNQRMTLADRIDCVGYASQYLKDLIEDVAEHKRQEQEESFSNEALSVLNYIEVGLHMISPDITVIEDKLLSISPQEIETYFDQRKFDLQKILAEHPELNKS